MGGVKVPKTRKDIFVRELNIFYLDRSTQVLWPPGGVSVIVISLYSPK